MGHELYLTPAGSEPPAFATVHDIWLLAVHDAGLGLLDEGGETVVLDGEASHEAYATTDDLRVEAFFELVDGRVPRLDLEGTATGDEEAAVAAYEIFLDSMVGRATALGLEARHCDGDDLITPDAARAAALLL